MSAPTTLSVSEAKDRLSITDGLSEITHPFEGGSHEFHLDDDNGEPVLTLDLGGETYNVDGPAYMTALRRIPTGGGAETIADRWPLEMTVEPLNWFFDHKEGDFKVFAYENNVVSFAKPSAFLFDPKRLLDGMVEAVTEHGGKDEVLVSDFVHGLDETRFNVHVPEGWNDSFVEARPGDKTLGGISFSGSILGKSKQELAVFTHRVLCSNGMISPDGVSRFSVGHGDEESDGDLDRLYEWVASTCDDLFSGETMNREFTRIAHLTHHSVEGHTSDVLSDLFARLRVPMPARTEIMDALAEEADGTMYGVVQAMTRAAEHSPNLNDAARARLMRDAGHATLVAQEICPSCHRPAAD